MLLELVITEDPKSRQQLTPYRGGQRGTMAHIQEQIFATLNRNPEDRSTKDVLAVETYLQTKFKALDSLSKGNGIRRDLQGQGHQDKEAKGLSSVHVSCSSLCITIVVYCIDQLKRATRVPM